MGKASAAQRRGDNRNTIRRYSTSGSGAPGDIEKTTNEVLARISGVKFAKFLGYGGEGVACLVDVENRQGGSNKAVLKIALSDDEWAIGNMLQEKKCQLNLRRATHVVQMMRYASLRGAPNTPEDAREDALIDGDKRFYFMELMKTGDMHTVIGRAGNTGDRLPSRLLWKIFACRQFFSISSYPKPLY